MRLAVLVAASSLLLLAAGGGCGDNLPSASFIDKLRVLAVQAEPSEVAPGTPTTLQVLAVQPVVPSPSPRDALWIACNQPPGALQPTPCAVDQNTVPPLCGIAPASVCIIGAGETITYTPDASFIGSDRTGGVLLTVVVTDADNGGGATPGARAAQCLIDTQANGGKPRYPDNCVIAFKRLPLDANAGAMLNKNPTLSALTLTPKDGAPISLTDGSAHFPVGTDKSQPSFTLDAVRSDDSAELDANGNYEALSLSFFTTSGKLEAGRSAFDPPGCAAQSDCPMKAPSSDANTKWTVPKQAQLDSTTDSTHSVEFWAIIRDDRGGVGWLKGTATPQ